MSKKRPQRVRRFRSVQRLEDVEIIVKDPCLVSWSDLVGDRHVRKCYVCQLNVYNFIGLSPQEILALINQHEGKLCAQFYARADGTMTLEPCDEERNQISRGGLFISRPTETL